MEQEDVMDSVIMFLAPLFKSYSFKLHLHRILTIDVL